MTGPEFMRVPAATTDPQLELDILRSRVDLSELPPVSRAVTEQIVAATADIGYAADLICLEAALEAAVAALVGGAAVIADGPMTAVGIVGRPVICKFAEPLTERLARTAGISPPAAGVRLALAEAGPGAVWLVDSEPAAINEILTRGAEPALVIAMPAGFSAAVAAKRTLRDSGAPCLTNMSAKGGPVAAAAACAALLDLAAAADPAAVPRPSAARQGVADPDRTRLVVTSRRAATL